MNDTLKSILVIGGIILFFIILNEFSKSDIMDNKYNVELNKYYYNICGIEFSLYDYMYGDEIDLNQLLNHIEDSCY